MRSLSYLLLCLFFTLSAPKLSGQIVHILETELDSIHEELERLKMSALFRPLKKQKARKYYEASNNIMLSLIELEHKDTVKLYNRIGERAEILQYLGKYSEAIKLYKEQIDLASQKEFIKKTYPSYTPEYHAYFYISPIINIVTCYKRETFKMEPLMQQFVKHRARYRQYRRREKRMKNVSYAFCDVIIMCEFMDSFRYLIKKDEEELAWKLVSYNYQFEYGSMYQACGVAKYMVDELQYRYSSEELETFIKEAIENIRYPPVFFQVDALPNYGIIELLGEEFKIMIYPPEQERCGFNKLDNEGRKNVLAKIFKSSDFYKSVLIYD